MWEEETEVEVVVVEPKPLQPDEPQPVPPAPLWRQDLLKIIGVAVLVIVVAVVAWNRGWIGKEEQIVPRLEPELIAASEPKAIETVTVNGVSFDMVRVEGGTFTMGATAEQGENADNNEKPAHRVTLSDSYIGKHEVTQLLWIAVMGSNPSYFQGNNNPVERVSWEDCQEFIVKLNKLTGKHFALPTEAQWEFAARGGNKSLGYKYSGSNNISEVAWYVDNSGDRPHRVVTKQANELGLYDMSGNVYEWCQDWYGMNYYSSSSLTNPQGPSIGSYRVVRGGGYCFDATKYCRISSRGCGKPDDRYRNWGFRLVALF